MQTLNFMDFVALLFDSSNLFVATQLILLSSHGQFLSKYCLFSKPRLMSFPLTGAFPAAVYPAATPPGTHTVTHIVTLAGSVPLTLQFLL